MTFSVQRNKPTGVLYANARTPAKHARIDVLDIGKPLVGISHLVLARVDAETGVLYGLTIADEDAFKRLAKQHYLTSDIRKALRLILEPLVLGVEIRRARRVTIA